MLGIVSGGGEEVDAYVIGVDEVVKEFEGRCVAIIHRLDDDDDKLVLMSEEKEAISNEEIIKATHFQERAFEIEIWK